MEEILGALWSEGTRQYRDLSECGSSNSHSMQNDSPVKIFSCSVASFPNLTPPSVCTHTHPNLNLVEIYSSENLQQLVVYHLSELRYNTGTRYKSTQERGEMSYFSILNANHSYYWNTSKEQEIKRGSAWNSESTSLSSSSLFPGRVRMSRGPFGAFEKLSLKHSFFHTRFAPCI